MKIELSKIATTAPKGFNKKQCRKDVADMGEQIEELQKIMWAQGKHSLLVVFQGMDASGKDGATRRVFKHVNPAGCRVHSFKKPTDLEFAHDFLWRCHQVAPADGYIQIFNRSHYEDVLIQRVHNWIDMDTVKSRFEHINAFEKLMAANGTKILKFYLHISKEAQEESLTDRIKDPTKHWKHNDGDWKEREHWGSYMAAYEDVFVNCGPDFPWTIVPSDNNWYKEYLVASKVLETLQGMNLEYPPLDTELEWENV